MCAAYLKHQAANNPMKDRRYTNKSQTNNHSGQQSPDGHDGRDDSQYSGQRHSQSHQQQRQGHQQQRQGAASSSQEKGSDDPRQRNEDDKPSSSPPPVVTK